MVRHDAGEAFVIPVILRPCEWHETLFGKLQVLPRNAKPVSDWPRQDSAFADIARGLREVV